MERPEDNREFPRVELQRPVKFKVPGQIDISIASIKNISGGGVCLKSKQKFEINQNIQLDFELPGGAESIIATGKIAWCDKLTEERKEPLYLLGVRFTNIDENKKNKIIDFVAQRLKRQLQDALKEDKSTEDSSTIPRKTILAIDDDIVALKIIKDVFGDDFDVLTATDGLAGLEIAKEKKPDLIILDLILPKMDGFSVLMLLKDFEETKNIPVIMLTVVREKEKIMQVAQYGITDYIVKPFKSETLMNKIKNILSG